VNISCDAVRNKIRNFLETGEMKVGEFQKAIGASSSTYSAFMRKTGPMGGSGSTVYGNAFAFFKHRQLNGVKAPKKKKVDEKEKEKADTNFDGIVLEGEEDCEVPVFDSCDEIRRKINAYLAKTGMTKAAFAREIAKSFGPEEKKINPNSLTVFLAKRGPMAGNTTAVYYGSYVFFEKMRVRDGKPMTEHRLSMEEEWDGCDPRFWSQPGVDLKKVIDRIQYIVPAYAGNMYQDEYGKPAMGW
jgi:hypothetical protein